MPADTAGHPPDAAPATASARKAAAVDWLAQVIGDDPRARTHNSERQNHHTVALNQHTYAGSRYKLTGPVAPRSWPAALASKFHDGQPTDSVDLFRAVG